MAGLPNEPIRRSGRASRRKSSLPLKGHPGVPQARGALGLSVRARWAITLQAPLLAYTAMLILNTFFGTREVLAAGVVITVTLAILLNDNRSARLNWLLPVAGITLIAFLLALIPPGGTLLKPRSSFEPGAELDGIHAPSADLIGVSAHGASLRGADLRETKLSGADLRGAALNGAGLRRADLRNANLSGANLAGADLTGANLAGACLAGANLTAALVQDADATGAAVRGVIGVNATTAAVWPTELRDSPACGLAR